MDKKGIMNQIVSVFILMLVISLLAGMTFLFIVTLKSQAVDTSQYVTETVLNEAGQVNSTTYYLTHYTDIGFSAPAITTATNTSSGIAVASGNWTLATSGSIINASAVEWNTVTFNYTYAHPVMNAYNSINKTEAAGYQVIGYLGILFLALIFGAILTVVLRVILPYINIGQSMGGF